MTLEVGGSTSLSSLCSRSRRVSRAEIPLLFSPQFVFFLLPVAIKCFLLYHLTFISSSSSFADRTIRLSTLAERSSTQRKRDEIAIEQAAGEQLSFACPDEI